MKVAFLLKDLQLSGGVNVVVHHARELQRRHGFEVVLLRTAVQDVPDWGYEGLGELRIEHLADVAGERFDLAVATWWETALQLFDVDARRHAYFVQLLEDSHYDEGLPERHGFALTLGLPAHLVTEARWIADTLEELQPGAAVRWVRNGIPKDVFASPAEVEPAVGGPLRVVIEGNPSLVRKGVPHALRALRHTRELIHVTLVSGERAGAGHDAVDEVLSGLSAREMAALFARSHVLLKLSRAEGMYGPPLEAFHMGCTVVTTPVTGHDEYVEHRVNGLVVDWDDPSGTGAALDLLARDRRLLHRLRTGALRTASTWPSWEGSSTLFAAALRSIVAGPPVDPAIVGRRAAADLATTLNEMDAMRLEYLGFRHALSALRSERAVRAAVAAREAARPYAERALSAARRLSG